MHVILTLDTHSMRANATARAVSRDVARLPAKARVLHGDGRPAGELGRTSFSESAQRVGSLGDWRRERAMDANLKQAAPGYGKSSKANSRQVIPHRFERQTTEFQRRCHAPSRAAEFRRFVRLCVSSRQFGVRR